MQPYNEDLVKEMNVKVQELYAQAGRQFDEQYPVWVARTVYDYCAGTSWEASERKHLRECREALGLPFPVSPGRTGIVRRAGRAFSDDAGPWCALGASLFWAVWGARNDPERLKANCAYLRSKGVDFVRILLSVGAQGGWSNRSINPHDPNWERDVRATFEILRDSGLRASVTILGDYPDNAEEVCRKAYSICEDYPEQVQYIEICNESFQVWLGGPPRFIAITRELASRGQFLVASSCAQKGALWNDVGTIGTAHLSRNCSTWEGHYRPVRQPWGYNSEEEEDAQEFCVNQEPIGPDSSVESEKDPAKLTSGALVTWIAGMCGYVLHAGAGIRGGGAEDVARGRKANWMDESEAGVAFDAINEIRKTLPPDLPNWARKNAHWPDAPFTVDRVRTDNNSYGVVRAYSGTNAGQHVTIAFGVNDHVQLRGKSFNVITTQQMDGTVVRLGENFNTGQPLNLTVDTLVYGGF